MFLSIVLLLLHTLIYWFLWHNMYTVFSWCALCNDIGILWRMYCSDYSVLSMWQWRRWIKQVAKWKEKIRSLICDLTRISSLECRDIYLFRWEETTRIYINKSAVLNHQVEHDGGKGEWLWNNCILVVKSKKEQLWAVRLLWPWARQFQSAASSASLLDQIVANMVPYLAMGN